MRPFLLKASPILTVTYIGCNMEMRSNMYRGARGLIMCVVAGRAAVAGVIVEWFNYVS